MFRAIPILTAGVFLLSAIAFPVQAQQKTYPQQEGIQSGAPAAKGSDSTPGIPPDQAGPGMEAKDIRGKDVLDKEGNKVATVKDMVKKPGKAPEELVVTVGSFLGFGGKDVRVPVDAFFFDNEGDLMVAMTEEELEQFPADTPPGAAK